MFSILYLNVQGLRDCISALEVELQDSSIDVICLSETWLRYEEADFVKIPGFTLVSKYCRTLHSRGGVGIWLRDTSVTFSEYNFSSFCGSLRVVDFH